MVIKKRGIVVILTLIFLNLYIVSAVNVLVSSQPVRSTIVNDHDEPAVFNFKMTNLESGKNFEIYTFEKFKILPLEFNISEGSTQNIEFKLYPIDSMKENEGYVIVPYYIRSTGIPDSGTLIGEVIVKLVGFDKAFELVSENINPDASSFKAYFYNLEDRSYELEISFSSSFIDDQVQKINLKPYERKEIILNINKDKIKSLNAGDYNLRALVSLNDRKVNYNTNVKILEKSGLSVSESFSGVIVRKNTITKINEGNIPTVATISMNKNVISRLFSSFSVEPSKIQRNGLVVYYYWQKELGPNESLGVTSTTNWVFPLIIVCFVIVILVLVNNIYRKELIIRKSIRFVKTKNSYFALRVILNVKSRKFNENVTIYDRIPVIAKIYDRFDLEPSSVDHDKGKISWNFPKLVEGEERELSYIIYSKINVIGRFELPSAVAMFESEGKPAQVRSNRVFFVNSVKKDEEIEER